jgi:uncharacterized membrane protein
MWQAALLVACILASVFAAPHLPARVPIHWGLQGQPDAWGSPAFALWFGPFNVVLMLVLTVAIPWLPRGRNVARFSRTYGKAMLIVSGLMTFLHFAILHATWRGGDLPSTFLVGLFLFFAALGNLLGKVRQNPYLGVRTPWTLKSERVWEATHRRAAWIFVVGGLVGAALVAAGAPMAAALPIFFFIGFAPILDSYFIYRRLEGGPHS